MRICIATGGYFKPGETFVNRHIGLLFGGETVVLCGEFFGENPYQRPVLAIEDQAVPTLDRILSPYWAAKNKLKYSTTRPPYGKIKREIKAYLRQHDVSVILAEFGAVALTFSPIATELGIPMFAYFRGYDASAFLRRKENQEAYRRLMPRLAGTFAVSQFLLNNLAAFGIQHHNTHVMPSGVDVRRFKPGDKRSDSFLTVGRFVEKKAPLITIKCFHKATTSRPNSVLTMIGDGPLLGKARDLTRELGIEDRVRFVGHQGHEAVRDALTNAMFFLQHSITGADGDTEGMPTAIQEAMASGCIVISTRHAGISEAIDEGVSGYLTDELDEEGFTRSIRQAMELRNPEEMAKRARAAAVKKFDNDAFLVRLETIIRDALERGSSRTPL
ncbi:MAG: glycosyltransferase [Rhodobacteraceae bacterium]|nr:glycosyltransferase [Paracoccaceae bacterium]MCW9043913.1 glycosyltransferase [Pseudopelagicola sp.]